MKEFVFDSLPKSLNEILALPQAAMSTPYETAALTVLALCVYPTDKDAAYAILDHLRGPRKLTNMDKQFIRDRFMDGKTYIPRSYFTGATPGNGYTPNKPFQLAVAENPHSFAQENMAKLYLTSAGADSPRAVELRLAKDGKWYLWEQYLLAGIREPESKVIVGTVEVVKTVCMTVRSLIGTVESLNHLFVWSVFLRNSIVVGKNNGVSSFKQRFRHGPIPARR